MSMERPPDELDNNGKPPSEQVQHQKESVDVNRGQEDSVREDDEQQQHHQEEESSFNNNSSMESILAPADLDHFNFLIDLNKEAEIGLSIKEILVLGEIRVELPTSSNLDNIPIATLSDQKQAGSKPRSKTWGTISTQAINKKSEDAQRALAARKIISKFNKATELQKIKELKARIDNVNRKQADFHGSTRESPVNSTSDPPTPSATTTEASLDKESSIEPIITRNANIKLKERNDPVVGSDGPGEILFYYKPKNPWRPKNSLALQQFLFNLMEELPVKVRPQGNKDRTNIKISIQSSILVNRVQAKDRIRKWLEYEESKSPVQQQEGRLPTTNIKMNQSSSSSSSILDGTPSSPSSTTVTTLNSSPITTTKFEVHPHLLVTVSVDNLSVTIYKPVKPTWRPDLIADLERVCSTTKVLIDSESLPKSGERLGSQLKIKISSTDPPDMALVTTKVLDWFKYLQKKYTKNKKQFKVQITPGIRVTVQSDPNSLSVYVPKSFIFWTPQKPLSLALKTAVPAQWLDDEEYCGTSRYCARFRGTPSSMARIRRRVIHWLQNFSIQKSEKEALAQVEFHEAMDKMKEEQMLATERWLNQRADDEWKRQLLCLVIIEKEDPRTFSTRLQQSRPLSFIGAFQVDFYTVITVSCNSSRSFSIYRPAETKWRSPIIFKYKLNSVCRDKQVVVGSDEPANSCDDLFEGQLKITISGQEEEHVSNARKEVLQWFKHFETNYIKGKKAGTCQVSPDLEVTVVKRNPGPYMYEPDFSMAFASQEELMQGLKEFIEACLSNQSITVKTGSRSSSSPVLVRMWFSGGLYNFKSRVQIRKEVIELLRGGWRSLAS